MRGLLTSARLRMRLLSSQLLPPRSANHVLCTSQGPGRDYSHPKVPPTLEVLTHVISMLSDVRTRFAAGEGAVPDGGDLFKYVGSELRRLGIPCESFQPNRLPAKATTSKLHVLKIVAECPLKGK